MPPFLQSWVGKYSWSADFQTKFIWLVTSHAEPGDLNFESLIVWFKTTRRLLEKVLDFVLCVFLLNNTNMGALESKRWSELPPETPQAVDKRLTRLQIPDPRSPCPEGQRTPIQLEDYEESPQNRELNIVDPRSPSFLVDRTPITVAARKNIRKSKSTVADQQEAKTDSSDQEELQSGGNKDIDPAVCQEPPSPNIVQINKLLSEVNISPVSPGAPLSKQDTARLLKKTTSPSDFRRRRRLSGRRQSLPQKLFSDKVAPVPRSPLAQRNSVDLTEAVKKGNKLSFRALKTKRSSLQEGLYSGKENSQTPLVMWLILFYKFENLRNWQKKERVFRKHTLLTDLCGFCTFLSYKPE